MTWQLVPVAALACLATSGAQALELSSPSVVNGASLSADQVKNGCGGKNISPALSWTGAPATTKSFALTVFDPDAHGGWWHWLVIDIPAGTSSLPAGSAPPKGAVQLENDFGDASFDGPCPPPGSGPHHYEFTLWALPDATLPLAGNAKPADVASYLKAHAVGQARLTGMFER